MVYKVRPQKEDPNHTRITIGGNCIYYQGDVGTPTASLKLFKLILDSVLSRQGLLYAAFYIKNFYLNNPLNQPKYVKIRLSNILQEFIYKYELETCTRDGWVYFKILKGVYVLPQAGKLANDILRKRLSTDVYYEAATTPGLWLHKWVPIILSLIVDDFGIEYVK